MSAKNNKPEKTRLHIRNRNRQRYDLAALMTAIPALAEYVKPSKSGEPSVDFSNPIAVKLLNKALLNHYYGIKNWDFPDENLCPPIPGRADYIHYMADLLSESNLGILPMGDKITCLDIGVGANCIYPIIGVTEYAWNFIGSDINPKSIASAKHIVLTNSSLTHKIDCRIQENRAAIFNGIINSSDKMDISICNPPFHASPEEALQGTQRKTKHLSGKSTKKTLLNFAGISHELICDGGEYAFIIKMIIESKTFHKNVYWFSTLVSKEANLKGIYKSLEKNGALQIKTIPMETGNKSTRIVAWTFLTKEEQKEWRNNRWKQ